MMNGNDFRLYSGVDFSNEFLAHYGVGHDKGGHSGRYPWGSGKNPKQGSGKKVFVSGSSKTQDKDSGYYRRKLPKSVRKELDKKMANGDTILVGDAPGIDRQVQDYLKKKRYKNVHVFSSGYGKDARYMANKKWPNKRVDTPYKEGTPEFLAAKDKVMSEVADEGIAVILDNGAKATRNNVGRLFLEGKDVSVYELSGVKEKLDKWVDDKGKEVILDTYRKDGKDEYQFYRSNLPLKQLVLDREKTESRSFDANEYEEFLGKYEEDDAYDRYIKLSTEIYNRSINIYDREPKSERAKAALERSNKRIEKEVEPLYKKLDETGAVEKLFEVHNQASAKAIEYEQKLLKSGVDSKKARDERIKLFNSIMDKFENGALWKSYNKAVKEIDKKERAIAADLDEEIAHVILQDLGFADTEENMDLLKRSTLLFID